MTPTEHIAVFDAPLPGELERELFARLRYISGDITAARISPSDRREIAFTASVNDGEELERIRTQLREAGAELLKGYREHTPTVLVSRHGHATFDRDPQEELLRAGELIRYGPGRYGLARGVTALMTALDALIRQLALDVGATEYTFPSLVGGDSLLKAGYHRSFPHLLTLACHVREDMDALREFRDTAQGADNFGDVRDLLGPVTCGLSPTVCYHAYEMWRQSLQDVPQSLTALGKCFRYESSSMQGLERLWDFTMREVVFLGIPEQVEAQRNRVTELSTQLLDRLELDYEISSATDPFFVDDFAVQVSFQQAFDLKFELLAALPYAGRPLAIGSINYHRDHFVKAFGIEGRHGEVLHTACVGFGFERLALVLFAQHGVNRDRWPHALRDALDAVDSSPQRPE